MEDTARQRLVLYGFGEPDDLVTWEFDGAQWLARPTPFRPDPSRFAFQLAYDAGREVVLLFGGEAHGQLSDTWAYGTDPDGDGKVGGLDNCRQVPNPAQSNADGDPAGDACDCAVDDPGSHAAPVAVGGVAFTSAVALAWDGQASTAGSGTVYDLARGVLSDLRQTGGFGGAACLAAGLTAPSATDGTTPLSGDGFWYVVRARNACSTGTWGRAVLDANSPCP